VYFCLNSAAFWSRSACFRSFCRSLGGGGFRESGIVARARFATGASCISGWSEERARFEPETVLTCLPMLGEWFEGPWICLVARGRLCVM